VAKAKVTDVTGREREAQIKANAEALAARAGEMSMATAAKDYRDSTEVVDLTTPVPTVIDEVEDLGVSLADDSVVVRVAEDLEMMTIGAGNHYSFQAGKKYKVTQQVANHLKEKGYLYDRL
jgi:predicted dinucleotide-binding enzyme